MIPGSEAYLVNGCEQFIMYINSKRLDEGGFDLWFFIGGVSGDESFPEIAMFCIFLKFGIESDLLQML